MDQVQSNDRRREQRHSISGSDPRSGPGPSFANKHIDGRPYTVELLDASASGVAIRRICEPDRVDRESGADAFTLELCIDGQRIFAWARRVRRSGDREAYRLVATHPVDRARLAKYLRTMVPLS